LCAAVKEEKEAFGHPQLLGKVCQRSSFFFFFFLLLLKVFTKFKSCGELSFFSAVAFVPSQVLIKKLRSFKAHFENASTC
jgi:hypothetical protein